MNKNDMKQVNAAIKEHYVPVIRKFYEACIKDGFSAKEALRLTETLAMSIISVPLPSPK